jgi:hypothetical protein
VGKIYGFSVSLEQSFSVRLNGDPSGLSEVRQRKMYSGNYEVRERNIRMEGTVAHTYLLGDELRVPATCDFIRDFFI